MESASKKNSATKKAAPLRVIINVLDIFIDSIRHPTVEPIIFLVYLGWIFSETLQSPAFYRRVCELYFGGIASCSPILNATVEDEVQMHAAEWSLFTNLAYLLPAIFVDILLGAYADRNGRKMNILIGLMGITISQIGFMLLFTQSIQMPLWSMIIFFAASGTTGYMSMIPVSCNAYLADITDDNDKLMIRSGIFTVFQSIASVIGATVAAALSWLSVTLSIYIELGLFAVTILYVFWKIPQKPAVGHGISAEANKKNCLVEAVDLLKEGLKSYRRKRPGHRRAFIFITVTALMVTHMTSVETRISIIIDSYVFRRTDRGSLQWTQRELGYWNGSGFSILIIGTLIGMYLFKQVLRCRQTTVILIAIASSTLRALVIALATQSWHMYLANAIGLFAALIQPAVVSFIAQLVPLEEIGRIFSLFGIGCDLTFMVATLIYSNIYRLTEQWLPGFLFFFIAGVQLIIWLAVLWVHIKSILEGVGEQNSQVDDIRKTISMIGIENYQSNGVDESNVSKSAREPNKKISIYEHALERVEKLKQEQNGHNAGDFFDGYEAPARYVQGSFY